MMQLYTYMYLCFWSDYRGGFGYKFVEAPHWDDNTVQGEFQVIPATSGMYRIYILYFTDKYYLLHADEVGQIEDEDECYLQILAHLAETGPFKTTGLNCAYKEEGAYTDPVLVTLECVQRLNKHKYKASHPCVAIAVNDEGEICSHYSISPIE